MRVLEMAFLYFACLPSAVSQLSVVKLWLIVMWGIELRNGLVKAWERAGINQKTTKPIKQLKEITKRLLIFLHTKPIWDQASLLSNDLLP